MCGGIGVHKGRRVHSATGGPGKNLGGSSPRRTLVSQMVEATKAGSWWQRRGGLSRQREQHVQKYRVVLPHLTGALGVDGEVRPEREAGSQS